MTKPSVGVPPKDIYKSLTPSTILLKEWGCCIPVLFALGRIRQEDQEFKDSQNYIIRPCLKERERWGRHLRRCLGPEGGILMNNISAFIDLCLYGKDPWSFYHIRMQQEDTEEQTFDKCHIC